MKVVILDTGCANLSSVKWAIERLGYTPKISVHPDIILNSDKLLIPGVGTAQAAMNKLKKHDLLYLIKSCTQPVLGICLGMQLLGKQSEENNGVITLGIIHESSKIIEAPNLPLPHIGWNQIKIIDNNSNLFTGISDNSYFYFVHSYAIPVNSNTVAKCNYGISFTAALKHNNFYGVQFHPERSGKAGEKLLKNFLEM